MLHFQDEQCDLRKIGTRPHEIDDFQALAHVFVDSDGKKQYSSRVRALVFRVADSQSWPKPLSFRIAASICHVDFLREHGTGQELGECYLFEGCCPWLPLPSMPLSLAKNRERNQVLHDIATKPAPGFQMRGA